MTDILPDPRLVTVALDANALAAPGSARDAAGGRLAALAAAGALRLVVTRGVARETEHPGAPGPVRAAAPPTLPPSPPPTHAQKLDRIRVRAILRGDAEPGRHEADAGHLSEAAEAGCAYFVTNDRRILRRRDELRRVLPDLLIVTPERLLAILDGAEAPSGDHDGAGGAWG